MFAVLGTLLVWTAAGAAFVLLFRLLGLRFVLREESPETLSAAVRGPVHERVLVPPRGAAPPDPIGLSVAALASLRSFPEGAGPTTCG